MRWCCALVVLAVRSARADPEVIEIHDSLPEAGQTRRSVDEATAVPGGLGDPVRAVTSLPGVVPIGLTTPVFYVRGAPPGDLALYVDDIRIPIMFHDGVVTSVIASDLIETVDLYASAVPARFAGIAGAAIELATKPPAPTLHGKLSTKLYESSALVETPIGREGSALVAARVGYPELITSVISPNTHLGYADYQARGTWQLGPDDRITLFGFGSRDRSSEGAGAAAVELLAADQHRADLRIDHALGERGTLTSGLTAGWSELGAAGAAVVDRSLALRSELKVEALPSVSVRAGLHAGLDAYRIASMSATDPATSSPADAMPPPVNLAASTDLAVRWQLAHALALELGGRAGAERSTRGGVTTTVWFAEPVIAARYRWTPAITSTTSLAITHQLPLLRVGNAPATIVAVPGFPRHDRLPQRSYQGVQSLEVLLPGAVTATASAFVTRTLGVSDLPAQCYAQLVGTRDIPET